MSTHSLVCSNSSSVKAANSASFYVWGGWNQWMGVEIFEECSKFSGKEATKEKVAEAA